MVEDELVEKNSPYVLGIDLGTSTSVASVYRRGRGEVLDVFGQDFVPSVVNYRPDADPLVGLQAKRRALIDPDNTIVSIKRDMGNPDFDREINGEKMQPEQVSALILEHLKNGAQEHEDLNGTVRHAIVTVPANFNNNQRQATLEAGRLAGLEILRLVEEPVAAAVAYGFGQERDQTILVYDLGGGTFDVCILKVEASAGATSSFSVLGKAGIPELGGDDFDEALMKILAQAIVDEGGPDVLDLKKDQGINKKKLRAAMQVLKEQAEAAKIELSEAETAAVDFPNLIKDENGKEYHLSTEITREVFNEAVKPLVEKSRECIKQAMTEAKIDAEDVDRIILVGGSTRVPCIRELVTEMLGKEPYGDIDPATAVSQGAAILGATYELPGEKADEDKVDDSAIAEVNSTSHYLGIETLGQKFSELLQKGVELPCENKKIYATTQDNQPELRIAIFQFPAETEIIDMNMPGSACLGEFHLGPLDPAPRGRVQVEVAFRIDDNGMLKVSANSTGGEGLSKELEVRVT
ncbi:MAG: Hsp70 family protein [Planctomycetota bacterium]